jgi:hypothetical protein
LSKRTRRNGSFTQRYVPVTPRTSYEDLGTSQLRPVHPSLTPGLVPLPCHHYHLLCTRTHPLHRFSLSPTMQHPPLPSYPPKHCQQHPVPRQNKQNRPFLMKNAQNHPIWTVLNGRMMLQHSQSPPYPSSTLPATSRAFVPPPPTPFRRYDADAGTRDVDRLLNVETAIPIHPRLGTLPCLSVWIGMMIPD